MKRPRGWIPRFHAALQAGGAGKHTSLMLPTQHFPHPTHHGHLQAKDLVNFRTWKDREKLTARGYYTGTLLLGIPSGCVSWNFPALGAEERGNCCRHSSRSPWLQGVCAGGSTGRRRNHQGSAECWMSMCSNPVGQPAQAQPWDTAGSKGPGWCLPSQNFQSSDSCWGAGWEPR